MPFSFLVIGDLNGRTCNKRNDPIVGPYGEHTLNDNGVRLIELCQQYSFKLQNGWFKHKSIHQFTWTQPTRRLKTIIDYIITRQKSRILVKDVRVLRGPECGSDHYLLISKIYFPFLKHPGINQDKGGQKLTTERYNLQNLNDESTRFLYQLRLATKLSSLNDSSAEDMYEQIKGMIHEAAHEALGKQQQTRFRTKEPW